MFEGKQALSESVLEPSSSSLHCIVRRGAWRREEEEGAVAKVEVGEGVEAAVGAEEDGGERSCAVGGGGLGGKG